MKKTPVVVAFVVFVFLVGFSANGLAERKAGSFSVTPSFGGYLFENNQDLSEGELVGFGLGYNFTKNMSAEFVFNFMEAEIENSPIDVDVFLFRANYLYHFLVSEKFIPFVSAGWGVIKFDPDVGDDERDVLVDYGVGLKYFINDSLALRGDIQHIVSFDEHNNNLAYTMGLSFLFGGQKAPVCPLDSDGDGVIDSMDQCPDTPAGAPVDAQGCPLDSDGDGVYDYLDQCPNTPAGAPVDTHGCPLDSDGDGVYDYLDKCPNTPAGAPVNRDGCVGDADGDGVPDHLDQCPDTPYGAPVDSQGCPLDTDGDGIYDYLDQCPKTPKGAPVDARGCWVIDNVHFDFGKSDLKTVSQATLNNVAHVLAANPNLNLEIGGHTDSIGPAAFNKKLSQQRAQAVMDYFVQNGIDATRLSARGYGSDVPAASNQTKAGRATNRRVELKPQPR